MITSCFQPVVSCVMSGLFKSKTVVVIMFKTAVSTEADELMTFF